MYDPSPPCSHCVKHSNHCIFSNIEGVRGSRKSHFASMIKNHKHCAFNLMHYRDIRPTHYHGKQ